MYISARTLSAGKEGFVQLGGCGCADVSASAYYLECPGCGMAVRGRNIEPAQTGIRFNRHDIFEKG